MQADERFARWYGEHHARIRRFCQRLLRDSAEAEDVAQEALLRAWERRADMRDQDVGAWLSVVARNLCLSHMRRDGRVVPLEPFHDRADHSADPALAAERNETRRNVRRALGGISRRHRRVLYLREVYDTDYEELGSELGVSPEGVRSIAFRARSAMRERLAAVGEGLSAIVAGVRLGGRRIRLRMHGSRLSEGPTLFNAMQSAMNAVLALGIALAGTSAAVPAAAQGRVDAGRLVIAKPSVPTAAGHRGPSRPDPPSVAGGGGDSRGGSGHNGLVPRAGVKPFNPEEKRTEITLHVAGQDTGLIVEGMDGDGLDPAYWVIDVVFGPLCAEQPRVCEILRGDYKK